MRLIKSILFSALLAVGICAAAAEANPATGEAFMKGIEALEAAKWSDAAEQFGRAIEGNSESPDYFMARGVALTLSEKFPQAIKDFQRSLRLREGHRETRVWMAAALRMSGDVQQASLHFTHGKDLPFDYASFIYNDMAMEYWQSKFQGANVDAKKRFARAGAWFAERIKGGAAPGVDMTVALFKRALERMDKKDYTAAGEDFANILVSKPDQPEVLLQLAMCYYYLNNVADARTVFTYVLTLDPYSADAYRGRAAAEVRLGRIDQAREDMAMAVRMNPQSEAAAEAFGKTVDSIERTLPVDPPEELLKALYEGARKSESFYALVRRANAVRLASNARRLYFDEAYQRQRDSLAQGIEELPDNPFSYVALAEHLVRNVAAVGESVEPRAEMTFYRRQTNALAEKEIACAEELCDKALKLSPNLPQALRIKIGIRLEAGRRDDAAAMIEPLAPETIAGDLELSLANYAIKKGQASSILSKAHKLRNPEFGNASEFDLKDAVKLEDEAAAMMSQVFDLIGQAAEATDAATAEGQYARAQPLRIKGDLAGAYACMQKAVELDPKFLRAKTECAGILDEMKKDPQAAEDLRSRARNLLQTTAATWLKQVWGDVKATRWTTAKAALDRAEADDPIDARTPAYRASVAAGEEKWDEAVACLRVALALEEARAQFLGGSFSGEGKAAAAPDEFGLSAGIRIKLGKILIGQNKFDEALIEFQHNTALAARIPRASLPLPVPSSMLPDADADPNSVPMAENAARLMAWSYFGAGQCLAALKRNAEAAKEFEAVRSLADNTKFFTTGIRQAPTLPLDEPRAAASIELARLSFASGRQTEARKYLNESASWNKELEKRRKEVEAEMQGSRRGF